MPAARKRFGQSRLFKRHMIGNGDDIGLRHGQPLGKRTLPRWHGNDLAARTQIVTTGDAVGAGATCDQRIDSHTLAVTCAAGNDACRFVPQNERCRTALVMSKIGVHIGPTDAACLDADQNLVIPRRRIRRVPKSQTFRPVIDKSFHFAVNPPSTIRTWPVT